MTAVQLGADMVEIDVRRTRDGHIVAFHDLKLRRLTDAPGRLKHYTYAQLKRFTIEGEEIPGLKEILNALRSVCQINLELKERGLVRDLAELVKECGMVNDVIFSSFHHFELAKLKAINQQFRVALLFGTQPPSVLTPIRLASELQAEVISFPLDYITPRYLLGVLEEARLRNIKINVWTKNYLPDEIEWLKAIGVDGIISDFPDKI